MPSFRLAHAWPGRHWPHSAASESAFCDELDRLARGRRSDRFDRNDVTWLMTALRAGAAPDVVIRTAAGVRPERLSGAHRHLSALLDEALGAWSALSSAPTAANLRRHGRLAAAILPVPVARLRSAHNDQTRSTVCAEVLETISWTRSIVDAAASDLEGRTGDREAAQLAGRQLWNPAAHCLWNDPYFIPARVGELTPVRVADLLGGQRREDLT